MNLTQRYEACYGPRVQQFVRDIEGVDTSGMPELHLPYWGSLYEQSKLKVGIVGRDTMTWGDMKGFVQMAKHDLAGSLHRNRYELDSLAFTGWTNNFGRTFWDTSMKILAAMHGVPDWKLLKRRQEEGPLRSFFWANTNSVERYEVTPSKRGVPYGSWRTIKTASEVHIDSLAALLEVLRPHVVFLFNWQPEPAFMDCELDWEIFGDHQAAAFFDSTRTHIIRTAHPTWLNHSRLYRQAIENVIERGRSIVGHI
ncbi:MAG: hypothetical protein IAE97_07035 [Chthoniobacterales bacterium]|nr:hypothetical protein [Chthoniobacterales bacterium]